MPKMIGFTGSEQDKVQKVLRSARKCIDTALTVVFNKNDKFTTRMAKYFAMDETNITSLVMKVLNSMKLVIDTDYYEIHKAPQSDGPSSNADCASWQMANQQGTMVYKGKEQNVIEAQIAHATASGASKMRLFPLFFGLATFKADKQCKIQSFLHELSHCAGGTIDVSDNGINPYGMDGVKRCRIAKKSGKNAENVAMFIASFY